VLLGTLNAAQSNPVSVDGFSPEFVIGASWDKDELIRF